jgi:hypothetical protein
MATISLSRSNASGFGVAIGWTPMTNSGSDVGEAWDTQDFADVSIQVLGTFGAGGNLRIQGCNEVTPVNWATLADPQGNALDFTAAKIEQLMEMPRWIRPSVTAGDGTTSLTVRLWARRSR